MFLTGIFRLADSDRLLEWGTTCQASRHMISVTVTAWDDPLMIGTSAHVFPSSRLAPGTPKAGYLHAALKGFGRRVMRSPQPIPEEVDHWRPRRRQGSFRGVGAAVQFFISVGSPIILSRGTCVVGLPLHQYLRYLVRLPNHPRTLYLHVGYPCPDSMLSVEIARCWWVRGRLRYHQTALVCIGRTRSQIRLVVSACPMYKIHPSRGQMD